MNIFQKLYYFFAQDGIDNKFLSSSAKQVFFKGQDSVDLLLVTVAFNNSKVLEWQLSMCRQFVEDNYLHVILDNSPSCEARERNKLISLQYNAIYVPLPYNPWTGVHNSRSHGISLDWAFRHVVPQISFNVLGFLDHDIFPVAPHRLVSCMQGKLYMGVLQERPGLWYLWPGFFFIHRRALETAQLSMLPTRKADTGGALWDKVFCQLGKEAVTFLGEQELLLRDGDSRQSSYYYRIGSWVHTVNASYWSACAPKEDVIMDILQRGIQNSTLSVKV